MQANNELRTSDYPANREVVTRKLSEIEYQGFLVDAGLTDAIRENREQLNDFLVRLGVNFHPDFVFGKRNES